MQGIKLGREHSKKKRSGADVAETRARQIKSETTSRTSACHGVRQEPLERPGPRRLVAEPSSSLIEIMLTGILRTDITSGGKG